MKQSYRINGYVVKIRTTGEKEYLKEFAKKERQMFIRQNGSSIGFSYAIKKLSNGQYGYYSTW